MNRVLLGLFWAPLIVTTLVVGVFGPAWGIFFMLPVAYAATLLLGLPVFILFRRLGWLYLWHAPFAGILASLPLVLLYVFPITEHVKVHGVRNGLVIIFECVAVALLFWAISVRGNTAFVKTANNLE